MMIFAGVNNESQELSSDVVEIYINFAGVTYDPYEVDGPYFDIELANLDFNTLEVNYPALHFFVEPKSKTAINGTYTISAGVLIMAATSEDYTSHYVGIDAEHSTLTIKNVDDKGNYLFVGL